MKKYNPNDNRGWGHAYILERSDQYSYVKKKELESLLNSNENQWKFISEEIKSLKKLFSKNTKIGERRTSITLLSEEIIYKNEYTLPNEFVSIILEFIRVDYPDELTIPFKLPQGYSKIKI